MSLGRDSSGFTPSHPPYGVLLSRKLSDSIPNPSLEQSTSIPLNLPLVISLSPAHGNIYPVLVTVLATYCIPTDTTIPPSPAF